MLTESALSLTPEDRLKMVEYLKGLDGVSRPTRAVQEASRPVGPCRVRRVALPTQVVRESQ